MVILLYINKQQIVLLKIEGMAELYDTTIKWFSGNLLMQLLCLYLIKQEMKRLMSFRFLSSFFVYSRYLFTTFFSSVESKMYILSAILNEHRRICRLRQGRSLAYLYHVWFSIVIFFSSSYNSGHDLYSSGHK